MSYRMGLGFDTHRLRQGRKLYLGGIEIPHEKGLDGHSDADVLLHAICDALLGAIADGDIGTHFPPDDDNFLNVRSTTLLERVMERVWAKGFILVNLDTVVIAQAPKVAPHRERMVSTIASLVGLQSDSVSVKATTTEGLGPEGRQEAISAKAIVLLQSVAKEERGLTW